MEAHAEFDVFHVMHRRFESAEIDKRGSSHGAKPGPERRDRPGAAMVDVVVQEIAKAGDDTRICRIIVVGAEEGCELRISVERLTDAYEGVGVR